MIEKALHKEIDSRFKDLAIMETGSEEHRAGTEAITKLLDRAIELQKVENDAMDKSNEQAFKQEQLEETRKDRRWRTVVTVSGLLLTTGVTVWGTIISLKFEDEHAVTTIMGRGFINKLLPGKK